MLCYAKVGGWCYGLWACVTHRLDVGLLVLIMLTRKLKSKMFRNQTVVVVKIKPLI